MPVLVEADAGLERGLGALLGIRVFFARCRLEVAARLVERALALEHVIPEAHVRIEADAAARVALDDRLPDLERLVGLVCVVAEVAGIEEFTRRAILDDRAAHGRFLGGVLGVERRGDEQEQERDGENTGHARTLAPAEGKIQAPPAFAIDSSGAASDASCMSSNPLTTDVDASLKAAGEHAFPDVLDKILGHFDCVTGTIHLLRKESGMLELLAQRGIPESIIDKVSTIPVGKGMAGLAAERREPVQVCNLQTDESGDVRPGRRTRKWRVLSPHRCSMRRGISSGRWAWPNRWRTIFPMTR